MAGKTVKLLIAAKELALTKPLAPSVVEGEVEWAAMGNGLDHCPGL